MAVLTNKDKMDIAEYIYSYESDILIIADAENVVEMLKRHKVDTSAVNIETEEIRKLIDTHVSTEVQAEIMVQYYKGGI